MTHAHDHPFGSARFASDAEVRRAFKARGVLPVAYSRGRLLSHSRDAGMLLISGAGAGKFTCVLAHLMGTVARAPGPVRMVVIDPKGEMYLTFGAGLIHHGADVYLIDAYGVTRAASHSLNLFSHLTPSSRTLVADCDRAALNWIPDGGKNEVEFFAPKARIWLAAIIRGLVHADGSLSLPRLREVIAMIICAPDAWAEMSSALAALGETDLAGTYGEMIKMSEDGPRTYQSVLGEITNALAPASDPNIQKTFVGGDEADVSFDILTEDRSQPIIVFIVFPTELTARNAAVLRQTISTLRTTKHRKPHAPRIHVVIDEAGQLGRASELLEMYTFDRGPGLTPLCVFQDYGQIRRNLGESAATTLTASADLELYLGGGVSDLETAEYLSRKLGDQTLHLADTLTRERAARAKREAIHAMLHESADPFKTGMVMRALDAETQHVRKQARRLMQPSEIISLPRGNALVVPSGYSIDQFILPVRPYFTRPEYAGLYGPNPYFDRDMDSVRVRTRLGYRRRRVIREAVPECFKDFPQYKHGEWQFIEGYRPKLK